MSLTEVLVFATLALFVIMGVFRFLHRSVSLTEEASESIGLQVGARNLLENMVRDVNAAQIFGLCEPTRVILFKGRKHVARQRIDLNDGRGGNKDYPFFAGSGSTRAKTYVTQVTYEWSASGKQVVRIVRDGVLTLSTASGGVEIEGLSFSPTAPERRKVLAEHVDLFDLRYFGYSLDRPRRLVSFKVGKEDARFLGADRSERHVAMVCVHFKARYDFAATQFKDREVEIKTKIWSYKLTNDARYEAFFSSTDLDTRY